MKRLCPKNERIFRISTTEARKNFSTAISDVKYYDKKFILHRHGEAVAAIVTVEDLEYLMFLEDRIDYLEARRALLESDRHRIKWEKIKKKLGLK